MNILSFISSFSSPIVIGFAHLPLSISVDSKFKKQRTSRRKEIQNSRKAPESLSQPNFENSLGIVIETNDRSEHSPDSLGEELDFSQIHTSLPRISPDPLPSADISFNTDRPGYSFFLLDGIFVSI